MTTTMTTARPNQGVQQAGQVNSAGRENENQFRPTFQPRFDIWEGDEELILYGDLPGVESEDLEIQFENRQLTILGKVVRGHAGEHSPHSEYGVGDFRRIFTIGEAINSESISAELHDGVLTLHLPKSAEARPRRIEVKAS